MGALSLVLKPLLIAAQQHKARDDGRESHDECGDAERSRDAMHIVAQ